MNQLINVCLQCGVDILGAHKNRKFCSTKCLYKNRYTRCGQRSTSAQRSKWYRSRTSKHGYRERLNTQGKNRRDEIQKFIRDFKVQVGCMDCGYNKHHVALEFDHISDNKEINVCNAKSVMQAKMEIAKCEVVCSNCHRIRTYNRLYPCKPEIFGKTYESA